MTSTSQARSSMYMRRNAPGIVEPTVSRPWLRRTTELPLWQDTPRASHSSWDVGMPYS